MTTTDMSPEDDWRTVNEIASDWRCHPATVRRLCHAGYLRFAKIGGRKAIRIRQSWANACLERCATPTEVTPLNSSSNELE